MALQFLPIALAVGSTLLKAKGAMDASAGARAAGKREQLAKEADAGVLRSRAQQEIASAQQQSFEEKRRARLVASRAVALAASGGGGVTDPTIVKLLADIDGEGAYRAAVRVYQGDEKARLLRYQAEGSMYEGALAQEAGEAKSRAYKTQAIASVIEGAGSLYGKYGMGGPSQTAAMGQQRYGSDFDAYQYAGY